MTNSVGSQVQAMREFRKVQGWSQERFARELGVATKSVYRWERGVSNPRVHILNRFQHLKSSIQTPLTIRELEVLRLVGYGWRNKAIASSLFVSVDTVKTHILNIRRKLKLKSKQQAKDYALREGMSD